MAYQAFAGFYDLFMESADYPGLADYLTKLLNMYGIGEQALLLDLACGTGSLSLELGRRGFDVIGVDASEAMLAQAGAKAAAAGENILFLRQRMERLDLYGTVRAAVCTMDSINHITDLRVLERVFERVGLFLEPGGVFIFDVNTLYKHREVLGNNTFVQENGRALCLWQNHLHPPDRVEVELDFFAKRADGLYSRQSERFFERAYEESTLAGLLGQAGLRVAAVFGERATQPPLADCQRQFWVAQK